MKHTRRNIKLGKRQKGRKDRLAAFKGEKSRYASVRRAKHIHGGV